MSRETMSAGCSIVALLAMMTSPALAQSQDKAAPQAGASSVGLNIDAGDIVVTARKIEENIQTVPVAVTAFSGASLAQRSIRSLDEIAQQTPNLYIQRVGIEPQSLVIAIRGQYQNDIPLTADPSVGIYVDGLYHPRTLGLAGALVDIQRVEILRGPQGTLFGRNTTGGAFNVLTADPTQQLEGSLSATLGNYDLREVVGVLNIPISETLAARFVGQRGKRDGYAKDSLGRDLNKDNSTYLRGKLLFTPTDAVSIKLFGSYSENHAGGGIIHLAGIVPFSGIVAETAAEQGFAFTPEGLTAAFNYLSGFAQRNVYDNQGSTQPKSDFKGYEGGLDINLDLNDSISIRSITGYQHIDRDNVIDSDGTPIQVINARFQTKAHYFSQELQLLGNLDNLNWVVGAYYGREKGAERIDIDALPLLNPANPAFISADVLNRNYAAFAQVNWEFAAGWRVTGGLRYSRDMRSIWVNNGNVATPCVVPAPNVPLTPPGASQCPREFKKNGGDPSWLISIDRQVNDDLFAYAKVAKGFRSGGLNFRGGNTAESFDGFAPETVTEYEVGFKSTLFDNRVHFNLAAYYSDYTNIQRTVSIGTTSGTPTSLVANAASARVQGFEAELNGRLTDKLSINGTLGFTDAKYKKFVDISGDRSKEKFGVPKWLASISGRYVEPMQFGSMTGQLDYSYQSTVILEPSAIDLGAVTQRHYGLLNGRISANITSADLEIAVFGRNLLGKDYKASAVTNEASVGFSFVTAGVPRTYGVQVTKRF